MYNILNNAVNDHIPSRFHPQQDCKDLKEWCGECDFFNYVLIPKISNCLVCHSKLILKSDSKRNECYVYDDRHAKDLGARAYAYKKQCENCRWNCSYYIGCRTYTNPFTKKSFFERYEIADDLDFWRGTGETYIANDTLRRAQNQQYHAHAGVSTVVDEWNNFHNNKVKQKRGFIIDMYSLVIFLSLK